MKEWASTKVASVVYNVNADTKRKWEQHSRLMSRQIREEMETSFIKPLIQKHMRENVELIQSIPLKAAKKIEAIVLKNLESGEKRAEGLSNIVMEVGKLPESLRGRAKLIARTEISKMTTGFLKAR